MTASHPSRPAVAWPWFLRFLGVGLAFWQIVIQQVDRPSVLVFAAGLIGAPEVYHWERKRRNGE